MADCIGAGYKKTLETLIAGHVADAILGTVISSFAICPDGQWAGAAISSGVKAEVAKVAEKAKREVAGQWPETIYYGKDGKVVGGKSFSGLFKELFGVPVTEDLVCSRTDAGTRCRALSTIENFRNRGYIIKGNGEDPPVPKGDMSSDSVERMYKEWKDKIIKAGLKVRVYHPEFPGIKQAADAAEVKSAPAGPISSSETDSPAAYSAEDEEAIYEQMMKKRGKNMGF